MLEEGLGWAGTFAQHEETIDWWLLEPDEVVANVEYRWDESGRKPDLWEVVLFTATEKCHELAQKIVEERRETGR